MKKNSENITLDKNQAIEVLKEVEVILQSLHNMGTYYMDKDSNEYEKETTRFIDEWQVTHKLANIRAVLTPKFDSTLGDDDMDELERAMVDIKVWKKQGD